MSSSTQGPEPGRGSAQRVSISVIYDGQTSTHKIRVPALACEGLVQDVKEEVARRAKAQDLVPPALELKHLLADDAVLCDTDAFQDAWEPGEALKAIFVGTANQTAGALPSVSAVGSSGGIGHPPSSGLLTAVIKRLGQPAVELQYGNDSIDTMRNLRERLLLVHGWEAMVDYRLVFGARDLSLDDTLQSLRKAGEDVVTIYAVPHIPVMTGSTSSGPVSAGAPVVGGDEMQIDLGKEGTGNVTVRFRIASSQEVHSVEAPEGSSVSDLITVLRSKVSSLVPVSASGGTTSVDIWRPTDWGLGLSRRHHHMAFDKPMAVEVEDLALQDNDGVLYVTVYGTTKEGACSIGRGLGIRPAWVPFQCKDMNEAGMACFLSTLYVVVDMLKTKADETAILLARFRRMCGRFHPAVLAMYKAIRRRRLTDEDAGALASGFFTFLRALVPATIPDTQVFQHSRTGFYLLLRHSAVKERTDSEHFEAISLECPLTHERLEDPVSVVPKKAGRVATDPELMDQDDLNDSSSRVTKKKVFSRAAVQTVQLTHDTFGMGLLGGGAVDTHPEPFIGRLLRLTKKGETDVVVWDEPEGKVEASGGVLDLGDVDWEEMCLMTKELQVLRVIPPLSLVKVGGKRICLTVDQRGLLAVYVGRPAKCANPKHNTQLWRPTISGGETTNCDRNEVAAALGELDRSLGISLSHLGIEEEGPPDEGIVVLLDISQSMNEFVTRKEDGQEEEDGESSDDEDSSDEEESDDEGSDAMDTEEEGEQSMPPFPDATDIHCPPELMCPLTHGILLDPVIASDGAVYERAALLAWIRQRERSARRGTMQSPVGRGMLDPAVELRYDAETAKRVMYWLQYCLPWVAEQAGAGGSAAEQASTSATVGQASGSSATASTASTAASASDGPPPLISITLETRWLKPVVLPNLSPTMTLSALLPRIRSELGLTEGGLATCPLLLRGGRHKFNSIGFLLYERTLKELHVKDGTVITVEPKTLRQGVARNRQLTVVHIHGYEIPTENEPPLASLLVRGNLCGRVLHNYVWDLGVVSYTRHRWVLWTKLQSLGDGKRTGWVLEHKTNISSFQQKHCSANECLRLQVLSKPSKPPTFKGAVPLKRIEVVKQLFEAFVNRSEAYDYSHHMGLLLFGSQVREVCSLTPVYEEFRGEIEKAKAKGDTRLYDAIKQGTTMLQAFHARFPTAKRRLLVLSDGEDSCSEAKAFQVANEAQAAGIVIDSVIIGPVIHKWMLSISKATSGYCFQPKTLREALKLNELETLLSLATRPPHTGGLASVASDSGLVMRYGVLPLDVCDDTTVPAAAPHPRLDARVTTLSQAIAKTSKEQEKQEQEEAEAKRGEATRGASREAATGGGGEAISAVGLKRLLREMMALQGAEAHPAFTIYPCEEDSTFWRMLLQGPTDSLYQGGVWLLYLEFSNTFPLDPPKMRFVTPILHANVNCYGRICHSVLGRQWTSDTKLSTVLGCVYGLLLNPDTSDPLDTDLAAKFYAATGEYEASIMTHTELHAKAKTLEQWKKELEEGEGAEGHNSDDTAEAGKKRKTAQQSGRRLRSAAEGKQQIGK